MLKQIAALLSGLMLFSFAPQTVQAHTPDSRSILVQPLIDNFASVSGQIYRGAAPSDAGIEHLSGSGIKTIIDLRMNGEGCEHEKVVVDHLGMKYVHIPMGMRRPTLDQMVSFLRVVNDQQNQPVFVHCRYGADRTGLQIGIYRILVEHWSYEKVYSEMREHHFKPWLAGMKKTVELVAKDNAAQEVLRVLMNNSDEKSPLVTATAMGAP
jgi:protein tyrosine phosphatase (PTP) superfamily phosphohydrolase (DUF442 family)